jgi:homoserine kinase type II
MAVFTQIDEAQLRIWLDLANRGALLSFEGIASGIENTNYFVTTTAGAYVLTLFEKLNASQLPFYLGLMQHLAKAGLPVPQPVVQQGERLFSTFGGKPACLVNRLPGRSVTAPTDVQCAAIGSFVARAHLAARNFDASVDNPRSLSWWQTAAPLVMAFLAPEQQHLLRDEMAAQLAFHAAENYAALPRGPVHADLFRDNALFDGDRLGGVIDFYFAGADTWLFDLAVCINDWCIDHANGAIDSGLATALLTAYAQQRPFGAIETICWPMLLRGAALRFWLSRLYDLHLPRDAALLQAKDPQHFERILLARRQGDIPTLKTNR